MKTIPLLAAVAAAASSALAATVNPARPMVTGKGNVEVRPAKVIVTNQTATTVATDDNTVKLDKLVVTGSLLKAPAPAAARAKKTKR